MTTAVVAAQARTRLDRLLAAVPLLTVFFWLCFVYSIESWGHLTPWLFTDELETTQLSRAIAETGAAARRGEPHGFNTLYNYLLAPAWWIDDVQTAYSAAKYIGVITMSSVVFPAYWLARLVVSPRWALFAAAAAGVIPALLYSSMFVEEPLAYPYSTLCLFLVVKALGTRQRGWIAGAAAASLVAPLVRGELAVIPVTYVLAALYFVWTSAEARRRRAGWSRWDWVGAGTLFIGALIVLNAFVSHRSYSWLVSTTYYKGRMFDNGLWAAGALTIGLGVLPVVAGLAALVRPRDAPRTPGERAFVAVSVAAIVGFGWYTAVKAAYISTVFSTLVVERNLIYLAPLLLTGTALFFEQPRLRLAAVAGAAALALYLILTTPYKMEFHLYSDAPGFAILQTANRQLGLTPAGARWVLLGLLALSVAVCTLPALLRGRKLVLRGLVVVAGLFVLAWNATGQIAAAVASNTFSDDLLVNYPRPLDWVDRATGGEPAMYLGQRITDANGIWLLEFWNRSIERVWSLDGTAKGPGPTLTPDLLGVDGRITSLPGMRYVVADEGINLVGTVIARVAHKAGGADRFWNLYAIDPPLRVAESSADVYDDGWMGERSAYSRFSTPGDEPGYAVVTLSRRAWNGPSPPGKVTIQVGSLAIGKDKQPAMGRVAQTIRWTIGSNGYRQFFIPAPKPPFRVEVKISPTFVPAEMDPNSSETRKFGAQVGYGWVEKPPKAAAP